MKYTYVEFADGTLVTFNDIRKLSKMMNLDFLDSIIIGDVDTYSYSDEYDGWND